MSFSFHTSLINLEANVILEGDIPQTLSRIGFYLSSVHSGEPYSERVLETLSTHFCDLVNKATMGEIDDYSQLDNIQVLNLQTLGLVERIRTGDYGGRLEEIDFVREIAENATGLARKVMMTQPQQQMPPETSPNYRVIGSYSYEF